MSIKDEMKLEQKIIEERNKTKKENLRKKLNADYTARAIIENYLIPTFWKLFQNDPSHNFFSVLFELTPNKEYQIEEHSNGDRYPAILYDYDTLHRVMELAPDYDIEVEHYNLIDAIEGFYFTLYLGDD